MRDSPPGAMVAPATSSSEMNTGATVTSFSLTITDTFTALTPSVGFCSGSSGPLCDNFQIHGGAANYFTNFTLTGPDCFSSCSTVSANFTPGVVTYNWSGGGGVPAGAIFDLNFASWNNAVFTSAVPEPSTWALMLLGFVGLAVGFRQSRRRFSLA
jgi:PEP-CTERM motif